MMELFIHNTVSGRLEKFEPHAKEQVKIYACGPTVYDDIHIGNARPLVVFDVLYRLLQILYPKVTYIRNITDVDDKINARAISESCSIQELCQRTIARFLDDGVALQCLEPTHQPLATDHIPQMIAMIKRLVEQGVAYANQGHVLFSTSAWSQYGEFAKRDTSSMLAGARVEEAPYKKNQMDFVLWKPNDNAQLPGWDSPWGYGRPGWHIECSAMAHEYLGKNFDIHCGGQDLIFPHHQNEIAQSCAAYPNSTFAKYWMHNGYVLSHGKKMSKSLGNFHTVRDLLETVSGQALRMSLLQAHYRQPLDFSYDRIHECSRILKRFYHKYTQQITDISPTDLMFGLQEDDFVVSALLDDVNTPRALAGLHKVFDQWIAKPSDDNAIKLKRSLWLLGFLQEDYQNISKERSQNQFANNLKDEDIIEMVMQRERAREAKDFAKADVIRNELHQIGIVVEDTTNGTKWYRV